MKKIFVFLFSFVNLIATSQVNDLASLSTGTNIGFSALFNEEEQLFGYISIYFKGKETSLTNRFEYVYLDKNLNKVSNNDFIAQNYVDGYSSYINKKGDIELVPKLDMLMYSKAKKQTISTNKIINIKDNSINDKMQMSYENDKLVDLDLNITLKERNKELLKEWKKNDYMLDSEVVSLEDGSFLVSVNKRDPYKDLLYDFAFIKFDSNRNELWRFEFDKDKKKKINHSVSIIYFDFNDLYLIEKTTIKKDISFKLLKINLNSGLKEIDLPITNYSEVSLSTLKIINNGIYKVYNKKSFEDNLVFVGELKTGSLYGLNTGYFRMLINKKTNEVSFNDFKYTDAKKFIDISEKGTIEKDGYSLILKDIFFYKNASIGLMFEKMKAGVSVMGFGGKVKATDLVYFETNEKFEVQQVKTFAKDKSLGFFNSDYLFSQYINNGNDVAFFYRDYQKDEDGDKNWNLFINTIKNGVFSQEKIKISSKENSIFPYVAKEGYILLREYNKKAEYNGIRLEKLNY